jgi:Haloacid dehalogenase superfamily, subfamily IA, variant 2 with 3rd motif like haloacid dehalogenase
LAYTFLADAFDDYRPFSELLATALEHALASVGADVTRAARTAILETYDDPTVFPDVPDGIDRLAAAGYAPHVVSNGDPAMLAEMVAAAGIGDCVDCVSADEIEAYKPGPAIYRHAAARTGTPIDRIVHVSAAWFDVVGARNTGMQAVWLDRDAGPWDPFGEPDATVESIHELADRLGA